MESMQVPEIAPEADEYAAQVGQEQYDLAQWMGMPESQAQLQGEEAFEAVAAQIEDEAAYQAAYDQAASEQGYQRFMDTMAANQAAKQERMASFEQIKRQKDLKLKEQRETERMADEQMKRVIAEKKAMVEKKVLAERAEEDAFKAEIAKLEREQQKREKTIAEAKARGRARAIAELQTKEAEEQ